MTNKAYLFANVSFSWNSKKLKLQYLYLLTSHNKISSKFKFIVQNTTIIAILCIGIIFNQ